MLTAVKEHSAHTIGVEFSSRTLRIGDRSVKLQVGGVECSLNNSFGILLGKNASDR